jgi:hypothetical protein
MAASNPSQRTGVGESFCLRRQMSRQSFILRVSVHRTSRIRDMVAAEAITARRRLAHGGGCVRGGIELNKAVKAGQKIRVTYSLLFLSTCLSASTAEILSTHSGKVN